MNNQRREEAQAIEQQIDAIVPHLVKLWEQKLPGEPLPYFRSYLHWFSPQLLVKAIHRAARERRGYEGDILKLYWRVSKRFRLQEIARQQQSH